MVAETPAQAYLNDRQRRFPPPRSANGVNRIEGHFAALRTGLPPELSTLFDNGTLVIGEVGIRNPDVVTTTLDAGGYAIEFSTEMIAYAETIVRVCSGRFDENANKTMALELPRVEELLQEAIRTYRREGNWMWSVLRPHFNDEAVTVTPWLTKIRGDLLDCTVRFMLAHELGHVAINAGLRQASGPESHEVDADRIGLSFFLPTMVQTYEPRLPVAAAGLAIRLFVSLERFGVRFASVYPPQAERLELLRKAFLPLADSEQRCDELSTVMVALLDQFDDLDDALDDKHLETPISVNSLRINFLSRLIEVQRGNLSIDGFIHDIGVFAVLVPRADLAAALSVVCDYYWGWADTVGVYFRELGTMSIYDHQQLIGMSLALRAIGGKLSDADRTLLPVRYR